MQTGADPLDAVIAGVSLVEDDPNDLTVGYGGLPNEEGVVELDAAVMHGPTHRAGAVAGIQGIRHPARVAQLVMRMTDHVLLVGEGARRFALYNGFDEENLLTEKARKIWMYWKRTRSMRDDWIAPSMEEVDPEVREFFKLEADDVPGNRCVDLPAVRSPGTTDRDDPLFCHQPAGGHLLHDDHKWTGLQNPWSSR